MIMADHPLSFFVEIQDCFFVVIAQPVERLVDKILDLFPGRMEDGGSSDSCDGIDSCLTHSYKRGKEVLEDKDQKDIQTDNECGQESVDQTAVNQEFDVHQFELDDSNGKG